MSFFKLLFLQCSTLYLGSNEHIRYLLLPVPLIPKLPSSPVSLPSASSKVPGASSSRASPPPPMSTTSPLLCFVSRTPFLSTWYHFWIKLLTTYLNGKTPTEKLVTLSHVISTSTANFVACCKKCDIVQQEIALYLDPSLLGATRATCCNNCDILQEVLHVATEFSYILAM